MLFLSLDAEILEEGESRIDLINSFVGRHPFASVAGDNDQMRRAKLHGRSPDEVEVIEQQRRYDRSFQLLSLADVFAVCY